VEWKGSDLKECTCHVVLTLSESGDWKIALAAVIRDQPPTYVRPGTEGLFENKKFIVTGRVCAQNPDNYINYWSIAFEDNTRAVLEEAYGHYVVMTKATAPFEIDFSRFDKMIAGDTVPSVSKKFRLVRKDEYTRVNVEGENVWPGTSKGFKTYDFFSNDGQSYGIIHFDNRQTRHFERKFFLPGELHLSSTVDKQIIKEHKCVVCGTSNTMYCFPYTVTLNCKSCNTRYELDKNNDVYSKTRHNDKGFVPDIEIGSHGVLDGIEFKVIGYTRKEETNIHAAQWNEYTLYNPAQGFAYLSEYQGHWIYVKEWPRPPLVTGRGKDYFIENDNEFELYNDYRYTIVGAAGEHIYDFDKTTDFKVEEYIHPPQILTKEQSKTEENWFYGEHIDAKKIANTFSMPDGLPPKYGIGAVQPFAFINKSTLVLITITGIALVIFLHLFLSARHQHRKILSEQLVFPESIHTMEGTTSFFTLPKKESNLQLLVSAPVDNSWLSLEGSFINTKTGKEYGFSKGIEYYSGVSEGERWSEGEQNGEVVLTEIPAGTYYLEYKAIKDSSASYLSTAFSRFEMEVKYDVSLHRNLGWAIAFILIVAIGQFLFYYYYDKRRWENSKYTPYNHE
jgi:hypothetical protein